MKGLPSERRANLGAGALPGDGHILCTKRQGQHCQDGRRQADQHDQLESILTQAHSVGLGQPDHTQGDEQSQHGAGGIGGALEAKGQAALFISDRVGHQCITWRRANALTHAICPAYRGYGAPALCIVKKRFTSRR